MENPEEWIESTDPSKTAAIHITLEDVTHAVTIMVIIKKKKRKEKKKEKKRKEFLMTHYKNKCSKN